MPRRKSTKTGAPISRPTVRFEFLEDRRLLSATLSDAITVDPSFTLAPSASTSSSPAGYSPSQIAHAYGFDQLNLADAGAGQTIAIVDAYDDPSIAADLATFDSTFGLAAPPTFTKLNQSGSTSNLPKADPGWAGEISLDVEWAHAMAPKANILLVEAKSSSLSDLLAAVNTARDNASTSVVSLSWGTSEFYGETNYDSYFTTPAGHQNITFVAASGDDGATGGAEWPAVASNVLSVGGTSLSLSSTGADSGETGWSGSSGGASYFETAPAAQSAVTGSYARTSPDVAYDADPDTGFAVYDSYTAGQRGYVAGWEEVGGTSAGAPQWAALVAIADQGRVATGQSTLSTSQTLTDLYSANSSSALNDVTTGGGITVVTRGFGGFGRFGRFRQPFSTTTIGGATPGYDTTTGLGTPHAAGVVSLLGGGSMTATANNAVASATSATSTTTHKKSTSLKKTRAHRSDGDNDDTASDSAVALTQTPTSADSSPVTTTSGANSSAGVALVALVTTGDPTATTSATGLAAATPSGSSVAAAAQSALSLGIHTGDFAAPSESLTATPGASSASFTFTDAAATEAAGATAAPFSSEPVAKIAGLAVSTAAAVPTAGAIESLSADLVLHPTVLTVSGFAVAVILIGYYAGEWTRTRRQAARQALETRDPFDLRPEEDPFAMVPLSIA